MQLFVWSTKKYADLKGKFAKFYVSFTFKNVKRVHVREFDPISQTSGSNLTWPMWVVNDQKGQQMI